MKPGGGKAKGSNFESQVAKKLSTALSPLKFIRTQGSGARVGGKNFEALGQMFGEDALKLFVGDVVPVNEKEAGVVFKHSIECKFYKTPDSFTSLVSGTANVFKWMQESIDDAVKVNRNPLLIFKWNQTPIFVACNWDFIWNTFLCEEHLEILNQARKTVESRNKLDSGPLDGSERDDNLIEWSENNQLYKEIVDKTIPNYVFSPKYDPMTLIQYMSGPAFLSIKHVTIGHHTMTPICVMHLDDLLKHPNFWYDTVIQS